jgi:hypothetical protein
MSDKGSRVDHYGTQYGHFASAPLSLFGWWRSCWLEFNQAFTAVPSSTRVYTPTREYLSGLEKNRRVIG